MLLKEEIHAQQDTIVLQELKYPFRVLQDHTEAQLVEHLQLHALHVLLESIVMYSEELVKQETVHQVITVLQEALLQNKISVKQDTIAHQEILMRQLHAQVLDTKTSKAKAVAKYVEQVMNAQLHQELYVDLIKAH